MFIIFSFVDSIDVFCFVWVRLLGGFLVVTFRWSCFRFGVVGVGVEVGVGGLGVKFLEFTCF